MSSSKLALAALVALPLSLASRASFATHNYTIKGKECKAMETGTQGLVSPSGDSLAATGTVDVVCPMVKHTSVPNGFNDYIWDVTATVVAGAGASNVTCHLSIYSLQVHQGENSLQQEGSGTSSVGPNVHSQTMDLFGFSTQPYWDEGIANPYDYWYSSEVICTMHAGTSITSFNVTENGTLQNNYRIYSAGSCKPTAASSYQYFDGHFGGGGGYWEAKQASGFTIDCPVPDDNNSGRGVQLSVGPSISGNGSDMLQCTGDAGSHWTVIPQNPSHAEWPTRTVSFAFKSGAKNIQCKMTTDGDNDGDGKVLSYRSFPLDPIVRTNWSATTSTNSPLAEAKKAFNGNLGDRWTTTNQTQQPGQWFKLDMGATNTFIEVVMDATGSANDYAHGYTIEASLTGANGSWTTIASGTGTSTVLTIPVPMTTARYIRINQTGTDSHWWSIHELNVYSATPHNPYQ